MCVYVSVDVCVCGGVYVCFGNICMCMCLCVHVLYMELTLSHGVMEFVLQVCVCVCVCVCMCVHMGWGWGDTIRTSHIATDLTDVSPGCPQRKILTSALLWGPSRFFCVWFELQREREGVCVCVRERECVCVCVSVCGEEELLCQSLFL